MRCPNCKQKAINFYKFIFFHPFNEFECNSCGAILKTGLMIRTFSIITFGVIVVSFFFTFPILDEVIHSHSSKKIKFILSTFLPYIVIPLQVVILFIPVVLYTWIWGKIEIVKLKNQNT